MGGGRGGKHREGTAGGWGSDVGGRKEACTVLSTYIAYFVSYNTIIAVFSVHSLLAYTHLVFHKFRVHAVFSVHI